MGQWLVARTVGSHVLQTPNSAIQGFATAAASQPGSTGTMYQVVNTTFENSQRPLSLTYSSSKRAPTMMLLPLRTGRPSRWLLASAAVSVDREEPAIGDHGQHAHHHNLAACRGLRCPITGDLDFIEQRADIVE
jgi:hypothetical protein